MILETTVVGSYPQPNWLIDRAKLGSKVPRVRAPEIWRIEEKYLEEAQDDATLIAIRDMERAGIDIITDGEMRRESYSNRFATALEGVDIQNPGTTINRTGARSVVPRIAGPIKRRSPAEVRDKPGLGGKIPHVPKLLDHVRTLLRMKHHSLRTEPAYVNRIRCSPSTPELWVMYRAVTKRKRRRLHPVATFLRSHLRRAGEAFGFAPVVCILHPPSIRLFHPS